MIRLVEGFIGFARVLQGVLLTVGLRAGKVYVSRVCSLWGGGIRPEVDQNPSCVRKLL